MSKCTACALHTLFSISRYISHEELQIIVEVSSSARCVPLLIFEVSDSLEALIGGVKS